MTDIEIMARMPSNYWEPGCEESEMSFEDIVEAEKWLAENGIPQDEDLPF